MRKSAAHHWTIKDKNNLAAVAAHTHFSGLTHQEAESLFCVGGHFYQEDLWSMPNEAFSFYLPAFTNYLLSGNSADDADSASAFIDLVKHYGEQSPQRLNGNEEKIREALTHIAHNQTKYDAPVHIYGNFHNRIGSVLKMISA